MEIHIVQEGETIESIADRNGIPTERLIEENGLPNPMNLVVGQSIVIVYPEQMYTVQVGDTLESISVTNHISVRQLYRNNPYLSDIVWFIDARSIEALLSLVEDYKAMGIAVWNIISLFPQLWLIIYTQFEIEMILS